ncbi:MAG TPA: DinB family protein [Thermomicrobiales bacterium]|nr:DinB family protein [Thermomicrobiales bacterium]
MSEIRTIMAEMRKKRRKHDAELAQITETQMGIQTAFTFETMMTGGQGKTTGAAVRDIFLRRPDHLEEHAIQIEGILRGRFGVERTQAHLIWAANQTAHGDLHAALTGLTNDDLDSREGLPDGEWALRQILEHLIVVERYYTLDIHHALKQFHAGEPHGDLPDDELQVERPGATLAQLIQDHDDVRDEALTALADLTEAELRAPARWGEIAIDVRFLLMRFAHHEREHTDQTLKWRLQRGRQQTEAERLLGLCWRQSGILEGHLIGAPEDILDRDPGDGEWLVRRILAHIGSAETYFRRVILKALEPVG